jgi:hypothetical protein
MENICLFEGERLRCVLVVYVCVCGGVQHPVVYNVNSLTNYLINVISAEPTGRVVPELLDHE